MARRIKRHRVGTKTTRKVHHRKATHRKRKSLGAKSELHVTIHHKCR